MRCRWLSIRPGITRRPPASITVVPGPRSGMTSASRADREEAAVGDRHRRRLGRTRLERGDLRVVQDQSRPPGSGGAGLAHGREPRGGTQRRRGA